MTTLLTTQDLARLVATIGLPKLIDRFRRPWGFSGILVKFKLEVGISEQDLLKIAEESRQASAADLMVANTLDGAAQWARLGRMGRARRSHLRRRPPSRRTCRTWAARGGRRRSRARPGATASTPTWRARWLRRGARSVRWTA